MTKPDTSASEDQTKADKVFAAIVCICLWAVTWGGCFGSIESMETGLTRVHTCRGNMAFSMFIAFFPPTWVIAPFLTGFYQDGLRCTCTPIR